MQLREYVFRETNRSRSCFEAGHTPELKNITAHGQTVPSDFEVTTE